MLEMKPVLQYNANNYSTEYYYMIFILILVMVIKCNLNTLFLKVEPNCDYVLIKVLT